MLSLTAAHGIEHENYQNPVLMENIPRDIISLESPLLRPDEGFTTRISAVKSCRLVFYDVLHGLRRYTVTEMNLELSRGVVRFIHIDPAKPALSNFGIAEIEPLIPDSEAISDFCASCTSGHINFNIFDQENKDPEAKARRYPTFYLCKKKLLALHRNIQSKFRNSTFNL